MQQIELTPWRIDLLEKLNETQMVNKFHYLHGKRKFISVFQEISGLYLESNEFRLYRHISRILDMLFKLQLQHSYREINVLQ
jgi:hypothetical protein